MRGFTLIELVIAITLMAILGTASFQGYATFEASQKNQSVLKRLDRLIESLDAEIATDRATSYAIRFESGALGTGVAKNGYRLGSSLSLAGFDWNTLSGTLDLSGMSGYPGFRKIVNGKIVETVVGSGGMADLSFSFPLGNAESYALSGFSGSTALNSFEFPFFEPGEILLPENLRVRVGFSGAVSGAILENVRSKKTLKTLTGASLDQTELVFDRGGILFRTVLKP